MADVTLWYSTDFRESCMGYDPEASVVYKPQAISCWDEAVVNVTKTLDAAFALGNSTVEEVFLPDPTPEEINSIEFLRSQGNRSLSVGDLVTVNGTTYSIDRIGFTEVEGFDYDAEVDRYDDQLAAACSDPECRLAH